MNNKWEDLPGDLLRRIDDILILYVNKVRLRCVCKSWRSELGSPSPFKHPLLLVPCKLDAASHQLLDFTDGSTYYLDLPKLREFDSVYFCGSSHGWVFATAQKGTGIDGPKTVFILDPLTGLTKQLPSTSSLSHNCYHPFRIFPPSIEKGILSSNPSLRDDYMIAAINGRMKVAYTKCGNNNWNEINAGGRLHDIAFYQGQLYGLICDAQLCLIEVGSSNPQVIQLSPPKACDHDAYCLSLVDSGVGLLMVEEIEVEGRFDTTRVYNVYKFDFRAGEWSSTLTDIGDQMLFVGLFDSVFMSLKDWPTPTRFKDNYIYFFDNDFECSSVDASDAVVGVYDLKNRKKIEGFPAFRFNTGNEEPIWFTPSS